METAELVETYLAAQPEPKQADLRRLHEFMLAGFPGCRLWFTDGTNEAGKVVATRATVTAPPPSATRTGRHGSSPGSA